MDCGRIRTHIADARIAGGSAFEYHWAHLRMAGGSALRIVDPTLHYLGQTLGSLQSAIHLAHFA